jgi:hypothetical protein
VSLLKLKDYFVELKVAILEQFKLLNLNKKKLIKLCTDDEVGGVKRKKNEKNSVS